MRQAAAEVENVKRMDGDYTKGIAKVCIKADFVAETLAEPPFEQWLEITDLKLNRTEPKGVARP